MKLMSLLLALVMALTPVLACAEEAQEPQTAEEMINLAYAYTEGENPDFAKAEEWYLKAYELGSGYAAYALGYHCKTGDFTGGTPDLEKAKQWYLSGAELGYVDSMHFLGHYYEDGSFNGGIPDYDAAMAWYKTGWEAGSVKSGEHLALFYQQGITDQNGNVVIAADHAELLQILEQFYASGIESTYAMSWLGWLYAGNSDQNVCEADYLRAFEAYKRGADWGNGYCAWQIGLMYEAGRLGMVDLVAAEAWMARGVAAGETRAQEDLERVLGLLEAK